MSLFDTYIPEEEINCPVCGETLLEWQGKDGPCALFVWTENEIAPKAQSVEISNQERTEISLPDKFDIYSYDCHCDFPVMATGTCENRIWTKTVLITSKNAVQGKDVFPLSHPVEFIRRVCTCRSILHVLRWRQ